MSPTKKTAEAPRGAGEKYPTKAANALKLGDQVMVPLTVSELHLTAGRVDVTYTDGSTSSHAATEVVPMAESDRLPTQPVTPAKP